MPYSLDAQGILRITPETSPQGIVVTSTATVAGALTINGTTTLNAALVTNSLLSGSGAIYTGVASFGSVTVSGTANLFGSTIASGAFVAANHLVGGGTKVNATNGAASAAVVGAGTFGNDLAGQVSFLGTAAGGGAQVIHVFSTAFATAPYVLVMGAGNSSFQAGFPTVVASTGAFTVSLTLSPVVGASMSYSYHVIG